MRIVLHILQRKTRKDIEVARDRFLLLGVTVVLKENNHNLFLSQSLLLLFKKFSTAVDESSNNMFKATDAVYLAHTIIELSSRALLIGKMMKTKSTDSISLVDFEKIKNELDEIRIIFHFVR